MSSLSGTTRHHVIRYQIHSGTQDSFDPVPIHSGTKTCAIPVLLLCSIPVPDSRLCAIRYQNLCFQNAPVGPDNGEDFEKTVG
jgi:hypothetical protein